MAKETSDELLEQLRDALEALAPHGASADLLDADALKAARAFRLLDHRLCYGEELPTDWRGQ